MTTGALTPEEYTDALREWHAASRKWAECLLDEVGRILRLRQGEDLDMEHVKVTAELALRARPDTKALIDLMYEMQVKVDVAERLARYPYIDA